MNNVTVTGTVRGCNFTAHAHGLIEIDQCATGPQLDAIRVAAAEHMVALREPEPPHRSPLEPAQRRYWASLIARSVER